MKQTRLKNYIQELKKNNFISNNLVILFHNLKKLNIHKYALFKLLYTFIHFILYTLYTIQLEIINFISNVFKLYNFFCSFYYFFNFNALT